MVKQLKTNRVAQVMLVAVILAALFACSTTSLFAFKVIANQPPNLAPLPTITTVRSIDMLEIKNVSVSNSDGFIKLTGVVMNNSPDICTFVEVRVDYLDNSGSLIAFNKSYIENKKLEPGQSSPFDIITQLPPGSPKPDNFSLSLSSLTGCMSLN